MRAVLCVSRVTDQSPESLLSGLCDQACVAGYNDLATAFMSFPDETIRRLFSLGSLTPQCVPQLCLHMKRPSHCSPAFNLTLS